MLDLQTASYLNAAWLKSSYTLIIRLVCPQHKGDLLSASYLVVWSLQNNAYNVIASFVTLALSLHLREFASRQCFALHMGNAFCLIPKKNTSNQRRASSQGKTYRVDIYMIWYIIYLTPLIPRRTTAWPGMIWTCQWSRIARWGITSIPSELWPTIAATRYLLLLLTMPLCMSSMGWCIR